ncbi:MAG: hypothetical protein HZB68_04435 [Candidatus Aenigmarchaeota archaeon]|nr:hypothetical protein [Candidatus Aenigmarchaeota archaeon]
MIIFIILVILSTLASGVMVDVNVSEDIKYAVPYASYEGGNVQKYFADVENLGSVQCNAYLRADFPSLSMEGAKTPIKPGEAVRLFAYTRLDNGTGKFNITVSFCGTIATSGPYFINSTRITAQKKISVIDYISDAGKLRLRIRSPEDDVVVIPDKDEKKIQSAGAKLKSGAGTIYIGHTGQGKIKFSIVSVSGNAEFSGDIETEESPLYKKIIFSLREIIGI